MLVRRSVSPQPAPATHQRQPPMWWERRRQQKRKGNAQGKGTTLTLQVRSLESSRGKFLNGAKSTVSTLVGDTTEYNRLEREIVGFTHCLNLAPEKLRAATFASMVKDRAEARKCMDLKWNSRSDIWLRQLVGAS